MVLKETIGNFQWFWRRPSPLNVFWWHEHCNQWFFNGFWSCYHRFQWFSMVLDHWSNDAMVLMDRRGLKITFLTQMLHELMARDGCEQWPFNLPFHRTGLTAAAAWAEIQSELGRRGFDQNRFPPIWSQLLLETIFGLLTGGSCGRTAEEIAGIHLTEIVLSISGTAQANITLQIDFVISSIYQPWDDKGRKA